MARGQKNKPMAQWSEQRRENAIKYNQDHYSVVGAKLPRDVADVFRALCASQGVSVSAALSAYIRAAIQAGTLDIIPAAAPVLPADVPAVGVSEIAPPAGTVSAASQVSPAGDACAVTDPAAAPETIQAPETIPAGDAAGEKSQAGTGTVENPSISQPFTQKFPESTRPALWDGPKSPSDCTNPSQPPEMAGFSSVAPRARAGVGNTGSRLFQGEISPEDSPQSDSAK